MKKELYEEEAAVAADWWSNHIGSKAGCDNGDSFQSMMLYMLAAQSDVTESQKQVFSKLIKDLVMRELKRTESVCLSVDYAPDYELYDVAVKSGISPSAFPCKTVMWIEPGSVSVKYGYQGDIQELYEKKSFVVAAQKGSE